MSTEQVVIEQEIFVAASPETVFDFLTDPALMEDWLGVSQELDARPGGLLRIQFSGGDIARCHYHRNLASSPSGFHVGLGAEPQRAESESYGFAAGGLAR